MKQTNRGLLIRIVSIVAVAALVFAACGGDDGDGNGNGGNGTGGGPEFDLVSEGELSVGSDYPYPPFEFEDESGALTGFDVELVRAIADELGLENTDDSWQSVNFDTIFQQLATNTKFDIVIAAVTAYAPPGSEAATIVKERRSQIDFTVPYYDSLQSLTVDTEENPDITGVDALPDGAKVGVQQATTGGFYAEENLTGVEIVGFPKAPLMYQQLQAGQLDAVFNDLPVSLDAIKNAPELEVVEQVETGEQYGIAVSKDNPELLKAINEALQTLFDNGTYAEIFEKYFPEQELPDYASE
jgi:polar amino acid transport system substrate-binding protein